jgi:hypothetical protein
VISRAVSPRRVDAARRLLEDTLLRWAELEALKDALLGERRRVVARARDHPKTVDLDKILPVIDIGRLETDRELLVIEANLRYLTAIARP